MGFLFAKPVEPIGQTLGQANYGGSTYGQTIPRIFGCVRLPTNLIWLGTVIPTTSTTSAGGKGGGGATSQSTSYSASFAVEIADGLAVGIAQIWADSTLVYNATNLASSSDLASAVAFLPYLTNYQGLHLGSPTQVPDPLMAQALAPGLNYSANSYVNYVNVCPAYRNRSYLVFNTYPFGSNSGRVPSIEVELCTGPNVTVATNGSGVKIVTRGAGCPANIIIEGILSDAGINLGNVNIDSAVNSILVPGLIVYGDQRQDALDNLLQGFDIGFAESGYSLDFFPLFRNVSLNIPYTFTATTSDGRNGSMKDPYPFVDAKEFDLPYQVNVQFKNNGLIQPEDTSLPPQTSYDDCTQGAQRIYGNANQIINVDMSNFALDTTTAARISSKQLYRGWIERLSLSPMVLPRQYINMEANDLWSTTYGGVTLQFRNTKVTIGRDYSVEVEAIAYNQSVASSVVNGATPFGNVTQSSPLGIDPILYCMNLPCLQSSQGNVSGFYAASSWKEGQGKPANIFSSFDAFASNQFETSVLATALTGTLTGTLAGANYYQIDTVNTFTVTLNVPDSNFQMANASMQDLENGQNLLYVGTMVDNPNPPTNQFEILQALDVSFNSDRSQATFSNLLRGRKGTENYINSHVAGEKFVFLSGSGVTFIPVTAGAVNNPNYELVMEPPGTRGYGALQAYVYFKPNNNNMRSLNPRFFTGAVDPSSNYIVNFSWFRRTRSDGRILIPFGLPVFETVESYKLKFYNPSGVLVLTRICSPSVQLSNPVNFQYTAAMRLADFGSSTFNLTGYTVTVCQLSTIAGDGNPSLNHYTFIA